MATKSVIEIDILDEKFQAFTKEFEKLQKAVKNMPGDWQNAFSGAEKGAKSVADGIKKSEKNQKDFNKSISDGNYHLKNAARTASGIAKSMADTAVSAAKWIAFGAIGGGFGLAGIASNASDYRRRAQGLGTTTGDLRASETNLNKYVDLNTVLTNITALQHDITQSFFLGRLGGTRAGNPVDQLETVMSNAIQDFVAHGKDINYAQNVGLTKIFSPEELIRLSSLSASELTKTFQQLAADRDKFKIDDKISRDWQNFWVQLSRAGQNIQVLLIDKLKDLAEPLTELSKSILEAIDSFLKNKEIGQWIKSFGESIKEFGAYLSTPEFKQDIEDFVTNIGAMAEAIANILRKIGIVPEKTYKVTQNDITAVQTAKPELKPEQAKKVAQDINTQRRYAIDRFVSANVPLPVAIGLAANIEAESSWNIGAENKGHFGLGQWDATRQKDFEKFAGHNIKSSNVNEQLDFFIYEMNNKEKKTWDEISKAYVNKGTYQDYTRIIGKEYERFGNDPKEFGRRSDIANRIASDAHVQVIINNNTDTNVAVKQLGNR